MEVVVKTVADDGGAEIEVCEYDGFVLPVGAKDILPKVKFIDIRTDDILIVAFGKSGTHWVWEITRLLVAGQLDDSKIQKISQMIDFNPEEKYRDIPSPRILNTHLLLRHLPADIPTKKPKIVYIVRNPKDVSVSCLPFIKSIGRVKYDGKWKDFLRPFIEGELLVCSWFDYVKDWEKVKKQYPDLPILTLYYEDLKENTVREVKKLNSFLGLGRSEEFISQVCQMCDFSAMKKLKQIENGPATYRKGQVGDWKNWFTVAQNEWFDQLYQQKMKDCPLQFKYTVS